jgi:hypothetical protein
MVLWEYQPQAELDDVPLDGDYGQDRGPNATVETGADERWVGCK